MRSAGAQPGASSVEALARGYRSLVILPLRIAGQVAGNTAEAVELYHRMGKINEDMLGYADDARRCYQQALAIDVLKTQGANTVGVAEDIREAIAELVEDGRPIVAVSGVWVAMAELGKDAGSDLARGKATYPAVVGIDQSKAMARRAEDEYRRIGAAL